MSKLVIKGRGGVEFRLNCSQFRSLMSASINSVQTRSMLQHFPTRCGQPDIDFTVKFPTIQAKHEFQNFVRDHQVQARDYAEEGMVTLWWPERNIENWTGYIVSFRVSERRFEYAPAVTFGVALVNSLMSERTTAFSRGASWTSIWGPQILALLGGPRAQAVSNDSILVPPTPPSSQQPNPPAGI